MLFFMGEILMEINTTYAGGRLTIYLRGELDHHEAKGAGHSIDTLLDEFLPRECVLNLSGLNFMDSSGIAIIVRTYRRVSALGGRTWVEDPAVQPQRVLDTSGISKLIPVALNR